MRLATPWSISSAEASGPKYLYTIPTVQNPTGTIMSEPRRVELFAFVASPRRADLRGRMLLRPRSGTDGVRLRSMP